MALLASMTTSLSILNIQTDSSSSSVTAKKQLLPKMLFRLLKRGISQFSGHPLILFAQSVYTAKHKPKIGHYVQLAYSHHTARLDSAIY